MLFFCHFANLRFIWGILKLFFLVSYTNVDGEILTRSIQYLFILGYQNKC